MQRDRDRLERAHRFGSRARAHDRAVTRCAGWRARRRRGAGEYRWDPAAGDVEPAALDGTDAVVHLAGETVAGRWTADKKERILRSRVDGTRTLSEALASLATAAAGARLRLRDRLLRRPRRTRPLTEESASGDGFLAEVVREWEAASRPAEEAGVRVVRTAVRDRPEPGGRRAADDAAGHSGSAPAGGSAAAASG